ncbi:MAG: metallophosphoesterase [Deltaproteobacteria bacterium]|nr:metallophosphoesterase [Deltaproteobacteria bacterium]
MKMIFFADTHLTRKNKKKLKLVETFIRDVCGEADMVFVLGDLFEFYHGYQGYIYPWYRSIVDSFKAITEKGIDMGSFFETYTGIKCVKNLTMDIEGKRTFISHGDEFYLNPVTRALKTPLTIGAMNLFGPRLSWKIAMGMSTIMSKKKKGQSPRVKNMFREYAKEKLNEGYDAVILAHTHIADYLEFGKGEARKVYLNSGDFIKKSTYIEYTSDSGFQIKEYKPV